MDVRASGSGEIGGRVEPRVEARVGPLASVIAGRGVSGEDRGGGVRVVGGGDEAVIARIGVGLGGVLRLIETEARQVRVKTSQDSPARLLTDLLSRSERDSEVRARREASQNEARSAARETAAEAARQRAEGLAAERRSLRGGVEVRERARGDSEPVVRLVEEEGSSGSLRSERAGSGEAGGGAAERAGASARVVVAAENASSAASAARVFEAEERSASEVVRAEVIAASDRATEALGPFETGRLVELLG